jgi:hypothetical protein
MIKIIFYNVDNNGLCLWKIFTVEGCEGCEVLKVEGLNLEDLRFGVGKCTGKTIHKR